MDYEHREPAVVLRLVAHCDIELTVYRSLLEDISSFPSAGAVNVTLQVLDTASSATYGGPPRMIDVDLTSMDARLLAAQLVLVAEQVEALAR